MIGYNEADFPHQFLLTNTQVSNLRKAFASNSSANIKLSKTQLSKMIQLGGFLGRLLGPLLKTGLPLISNMIKALAKSVLISLGLTAAASAADAGIHKKILESGNTTTLIISNNEIEDIIKIVKSLKDSGLLLKYAWVVPLKDKKGISIVNAFQKIIKESHRGPNKIRVDKRSEFYNNSFKK